jgi:hypothetical protein
LLIVVTVVLAAIAATALFGFSVDPASLDNFFDLRVINDTDHAVKIQPCWDRLCHDTTGMPIDRVAPGAYRDEAAWSNEVGTRVGVVVFTIPSRTKKCLRVRYAIGQRKGIIRVSTAHRCS